MSNIIIAIIIGGVIYIAMEFAFQLGKGYIIGLLTAYGMPATYFMELLSRDKRWRSKLIRKYAELTSEIKKKN